LFIYSFVLDEKALFTAAINNRTAADITQLGCSSLHQLAYPSLTSAVMCQYNPEDTCI
jgi:hypothetical protein